ncbi:MAG: MFS transporter [Arenimonas sp.]
MQTNLIPARRPNPFRVFASRNYALYFSGQLVSQVGTWMQQIALSWLTYKLTGSALMLAVVGVSSQLPALVVMPFAGVLSDRFNRHRILLGTQLAAMCQAAVLAWLALSGNLLVWHLVALGLVIGVITAFDMPVRSAFVTSLVARREDLPAAIAMNSSLMNVSRLLGPALAGFVVAAFGEGICFAINAVSYVFVLAALLLIKGNFAPQPRDKRSSVIQELAEGLRYAAGITPIRAPILLLALFGFGGMAYATLLPVFVKEIGGNANTLGYLSSASAAGSILGTAVVATRKSVLGMGKLAIVACFVYAAGLFVFAFVDTLSSALPVLVVLGAAMMLQLGCCNTILQTVVEDDKRGRVMSLFTMAFMATVPLGALCAGAIATHFGFQAMIFCCAGWCLLVALAFTHQMPRLRQQTRAIYIQRGIIESDEDLELLTKSQA